jgi:two-component system, NarL family, nitrate/nitrite response regulator NarL
MLNANSRISIAIVDDHPILRHGIVSVLKVDPRFQIIAEGDSATVALDIAKAHRPEIMLLDLGIPGGGSEALKQICIEFPSTRCIILTACDSADAAVAALSSGAQGYILKGISGNDLKAAIVTVANNETFVSPEFATKLLTSVQKKRAVQPLDSRLSHRESQILREVEKGLTNRMVAEKLAISEKTVKYYMSSIMQKYGVSNRVSAIRAHHNLNNAVPNS